MYRLSQELTDYLIRNSNRSAVPELTVDQPNPYVPATKESIGVIDSNVAMGTDFKYVIECPYSVIMGASNEQHKSIENFWLYKATELAQPEEPVVVPQAYLDPNITDPELTIDITDCCVAIPNDIEKLTCRLVYTLSDLVKLEPGIVNCLRPDRKEFKWNPKTQKK